MLKTFFKYFLLFILMAVSGMASAHQPNYVGEQTWVKISEPEISKAFYGVLPGKSVRYVISTTTPFLLYVGLLVPDLPEIEKNVSALVIYQDGKVVARLEGEKFNWTKWYEEFAGDTYWEGPEFKQTVPAGTYTIIVYSPDNNWGKYVLATGEKESFSAKKYPAMEKQIYAIKTEFFEKPWYSIFQGKIGRYQLWALILLVGLLVGGPSLKKLVRRKK